MFRLCLLLLCGLIAAAKAQELHGIENPLHGYYTATPADRFTQFNAQVEAGSVVLDTSGELPLLRDVLAKLQVPESSQMLVYSVTSLQKNLISPRHPRALYFNDDTYVGYVPGGRLEVMSLDPKLGSIFYISDRLQRGRTPTMRRSEECFNCHAPAYLQNIPAMLVESVIPGITGGGERAFRREQTGHAVPLAQRFGGWHVTGVGSSFPANQGNKLIDRKAGVATEIPNQPGQLYNSDLFLLPTSDVLPQLLHEHQVGFANRAMLAGYAARVLLSNPTAQNKAAELARLAAPLVRYMLFADEVPLPNGSVSGDAAFKSAFQSNRKPGPGGVALKDLDLTTRLMKFRCSYMIYSSIFTGLPRELKSFIYAQLDSALGPRPPVEFAYLPEVERRTIRSVLRATLTDLPPNWGADRVAERR